MDARREVRQIWKEYRRYDNKVGEYLYWYPFVGLGTNTTTQSVYDAVYDEAVQGVGGRRYGAPIELRTIMVTETEDQKRAIPEGRQPVQIVNAILSFKEVEGSGLYEPNEYQKHLNDMFWYQNRYYSVTGYRVRGRARADVLIIVEGIEVYVDQEMPFDVGPSATPSEPPWPNVFP